MIESGSRRTERWREAGVAIGGTRHRGSSGDSNGRGCCQEAAAEGSESSNGEHGAGEFAERGRGRGSGNGENDTSADIKRFAKNNRGRSYRGAEDVEESVGEEMAGSFQSAAEE